MNVLEEIIYPAVEEAQKIIPSAAGLKKESGCVLFGDGGLASLDLVRFIVLVEERIEDVMDVEVALASDKAMSRSRSPFATLGVLAEFVEECVREANDG